MKARDFMQMSAAICGDDKMIIDGLKRGEEAVCLRFFYSEIVGILHKIRIEAFDGRVELDEMVGELYLYLSRDNWAKLDGFDGRNGCRLRSWMIPVAWRFFMAMRERMLAPVSATAQAGDAAGAGETQADYDDLRIQIAIDVNAVLERMPNRRYAEILRLLLIEGYSAADVADMLGMKVENVYNLKHRAVAQFAELYGRR